MRNIFEHDILNNFDMTPKEVFEKTSKYLSSELSTGVISPVGSVIDMLELGARGIINVITLNCSFGNVVTSVLQHVRRDYGDVPLLTPRRFSKERSGVSHYTTNSWERRAKSRRRF